MWNFNFINTPPHQCLLLWYGCIKFIFQCIRIGKPQVTPTSTCAVVVVTSLLVEVVTSWVKPVTIGDGLGEAYIPLFLVDGVWFQNSLSLIFHSWFFYLVIFLLVASPIVYICKHFHRRGA